MTKPFRLLATLSAAVLGGACGGVRAPMPALFPVATEWRVILDQPIEGPLATDGLRVFAATRDGSVIALDRRTGVRIWQADDRPGRLSFGAGTLVVREAKGTLWGLDPATGVTRWRTDSGVSGTLPAVAGGDRVVVAGEGLAAFETASGRKVWALADAPNASAVPVLAGAWIFVGEADGVLRCRSARDGASVWTYAAGGPVLAAPLVDGERVVLGTTARQVVALAADKGNTLWRWRVGADVQVSPVRLAGKLLVASHEDVLYALKRGGGDLLWRAPLPSRPLSAPLVVGTAVLVACHENDVVGFDGRTGARLGALRAPAEIRTPPVVLEGLLYLGLRDRSVVGLRLGASEAAAAEPARPNP